ncbi:MAG: phenylacetic acid degradation b [Candidatus Cyclobacteriaceae bacterium M2_1C_046]
MKSLDPRLNRIGLDEDQSEVKKKELDQFETYEVFTQLKEKQPLNHAGIVHSPDLEMAFILAKEQYSRRLMCAGLAVVRTDHVHVSAYTDGDKNAYDTIIPVASKEGEEDAYQVFHLKKRGKQHVHAGTVMAHNPEEAFEEAKNSLGDQLVYNVWVIATSDFRFSDEEEKVIWSTLNEKSFRDAIAYKAADKIKQFKERQQS